VRTGVISATISSVAANGFENRIHRIGADSIVKIVIDHQGWGVVTVAQANNWQQGEFSVLCGVSIFDAQTIAQTVVDTLVAAHPTRHAVTHLYDMIANGFSEQKVVEGSQPFEVGGRKLKVLSDVL
tara:strand:+ start:109 stop:486 length:378 start_codon:yes stop_codon:yes gene_type:complete